jgi:hypothetical protein
MCHVVCVALLFYAPPRHAIFGFQAQDWATTGATNAEYEHAFHGFAAKLICNC